MSYFVHQCRVCVRFMYNYLDANMYYGKTEDWFSFYIVYMVY